MVTRCKVFFEGESGSWREAQHVGHLLVANDDMADWQVREARRISLFLFIARSRLKRQNKLCIGGFDE